MLTFLVKKTKKALLTIPQMVNLHADDTFKNQTRLYKVSINKHFSWGFLIICKSSS